MLGGGGCLIPLGKTPGTTCGICLDKSNHPMGLIWIKSMVHFQIWWIFWGLPPVSNHFQQTAKDEPLLWEFRTSRAPWPNIAAWVGRLAYWRSMGWLQGKSTGNHRFSHLNMGFSCNFSLKPINWENGKCVFFPNTARPQYLLPDPCCRIAGWSISEFVLTYFCSTSAFQWSSRNGTSYDQNAKTGRL